MKAPKRIPKEYNFNIPKENIGNKDRISGSVLSSILDSRIGQMEAITLPSEPEKKRILKQINNLPTNSEKMSSFLDFMVSDVIDLSFDYYNSKRELDNYIKEKEMKTHVNQNMKGIQNEMKDNESELERRIQRIAQKLNVEPSNIEKKVSNLLFLKDKIESQTFPGSNDYEEALSLLHCKPGQLEESLKRLINENEKIYNSPIDDNNLNEKQNELLTRGNISKEKLASSTLSQIEMNSSSDILPDRNITQLDQLNDIRNTLDALAKQVSELSSSYE